VQSKSRSLVGRIADRQKAALNQSGCPRGARLRGGGGLGADHGASREQLPAQEGGGRGQVEIDERLASRIRRLQVAFDRDYSHGTADVDRDAVWGLGAPRGDPHCGRHD
jgi:hypothetical protein